MSMTMEGTGLTSPHDFIPEASREAVGRVLLHYRRSRLIVQVGERGYDLEYGWVQVLAYTPLTVTLADTFGGTHRLILRHWLGLADVPAWA